VVLLAQDSPQKIKKKGILYFEQQEYKKALYYFDQIKEKFVKDMDLKRMIGLSYYELSNMSKALTYLTFYIENERKVAPKIYYRIARIYHLSDAFRKAAKFYKRYVRELAQGTPERQMAKRLILQCTYGAKLQHRSSKAVVSTLGDEINSPADDYRICFNPLEDDVLFFSTKRREVTGGKLNDENEIDLTNGYYRSDIYQSRKEEGAWTPAKPLSKRYNSSMQEDIVGFFDGGYQMVYLKGISPNYSEIVVDNYDRDSVSVLLPFAIEASSNHWDGDHFFPTDSIIIFASNRPGGYGGKDIYYATRSEDGRWNEAKNIGPKINTIYDEASPFLAKDGRTLYFSSNKTESMGGYDIYKIYFNDTTMTWEDASNVGTPINSSGDDKDFWMAKDGMKAYFSSDRLGGKGGLDLYAAYFRDYMPEQLLGRTPKTFVHVLQMQVLAANNPTKVKKNNTGTNPNNTLAQTDESTYLLYPIYYDIKTGEMEGTTQALRTLGKLLKRHPETYIMLSAHTNNTGNPVHDNYLSLKQAEIFAQKIVDQGVDQKQIWLRGCGQNYPIANNENFDGSPNELSLQMNQRIQVNVFNINHLDIDVKQMDPKVSRVMQAPEYQRHQKRIKGLSYRVQITQTPALFSHKIFSEVPHCITEKQGDKTNVNYMIGLANSFDLIFNTYEKAQHHGFRRAEIVPYLNGRRLTVEEAQIAFDQYPDLRNYLDFVAER